MSQEDFEAFWPHLARIGFSVGKACEVVEYRAARGLSCDSLNEGLDHADAAVKAGLDTMAKEPVRNPLAYVYGSLAKNGYFDRPPGYLGTDERIARDARLKAEAEERARKDLEKAHFDMWKFSLSYSEIQAIKSRSIAGRAAPLDVVLMQEWNKRGQPLVDALKVRQELEQARYEIWKGFLEPAEVALVWEHRGWEVPRLLATTGTQGG